MLALTEGRYSDFVPSFDHDAFRRRAESVLNELFELLPGGRIVAVSHGGLINAMLANVLGLTHQMFFVFPAYTAMSIVQRVPSGRVVLRSVNETPHLLGDRRPGTNRPTPLDG